MLDRVWEVSQDVLGVAFDAGEDDFLEHLDNKMVQVALVILACADLLIDLVSNFGVSLCLLLDQLEDVQLLESLSRLELFDDLATLLIGITVSTWSDEKNGWLYAVAELGESLIEVLL